DDPPARRARRAVEHGRRAAARARGGACRPLHGSARLAQRRVKVARTESAKSVFGRQGGPDPVQPPLHRADFQPVAAPARKVRASPPKIVLVHFGVQLTVPRPETDTRNGTRRGPKTAFAVAAWLSFSRHVASPRQEPVHRTKRSPAAGLAIRVTAAP